MRDLTGPAQGRAIRDLLQGLLITEVLQPSSPLWLLSGWVSDIPCIDNRARQFGAVDPDWPAGFVSLIAVLRTAITRGGSLAIVLRDVEHNHWFVERLRPLQLLYPNQVKWILAPEFHEKGLVGRGFVLSGSMNFTHNGIEVNDEHLIYRTDPDVVAERRLTLETLWQDKLNAGHGS